MFLKREEKTPSRVKWKVWATDNYGNQGQQIFSVKYQTVNVIDFTVWS